MQNAESDADRGDHNKSEEGVVTLVIACLSTAKFLEAIEEMLYYIPPFIRLFIKWPWLLCVHFRRDRIAGRLVMQIGSDLFCAIGLSARISQSFRLGSSFSRGTASVQSSTFPADSKKATGRRSFPTMAWIFVFRPPRVLPMLLDV